MEKINKSDVVNLIYAMNREEAKNFERYMLENPGDTERLQDHLLVSGTYTAILCRLQTIF